MQYVVFRNCVSPSVQAVVIVSYSSSAMAYKVARCLFIDICNADIRPIHVCYHQLMVCFQCCSVCMYVCRPMYFDI